MRNALCEAIGTFVLVFAGTGAIIVDDVSHGTVTHVGVSLVFGLVVLALVHALGDASGAHLNPAVTLGFVAARRFPLRNAPAYIAAQVAGGIAASALLAQLFQGHPTLGATLPAGSDMQAFVLEIVLTWILMLVILSVSDGAKERGLVAGSAIGAVVGLEALFAGPITGASMNPARSLAPAIVSGHLEHIWIYLAAPILGAALAIPCCRLIRAQGCCDARGACS
jgi:aquaporin NIP